MAHWARDRVDLVALTPQAGLPEFGNMIVQVGNSRLGCAGPESMLPVVVMDSGLARGLSSGRALRGHVGAPPERRFSNELVV